MNILLSFEKPETPKNEQTKMDMDDFIPQTLNESLNEWCARLVNVLTPRVVENLWKLLDEARRTAMDAKQLDKYLLSFQQLLQFVPKWSTAQVEEVRKYIIQKSGCQHLEELITCAHIILTKALVCARPGNRQKQLNVSIPKIDVFLHKVFIKSAGHAYRNAYLFEKEVSKLQQQRNMHDLEKLVHRAILDVIRENIPEEEIIRAFLDENYEFEEETIIENIPDSETVEEKGAGGSIVPNSGGETVGNGESVPYIQDVSTEPVITRLETEDVGLEIMKTASAGGGGGGSGLINTEFQPKTVQQLAEQSSAMDYAQSVEKIGESIGNGDGLLDVFDLDAEMGGIGKEPLSLGATDYLDKSSGGDFMLDIEDIA
jgi:hypothetical protein